MNGAKVLPGTHLVRMDVKYAQARAAVGTSKLTIAPK